MTDPTQPPADSPAPPPPGPQGTRQRRRAWGRKEWILAAALAAAIATVVTVGVANQPTPAEEQQARSDSAARIEEALRATVLFEVTTSDDTTGRSVDSP